MLGIIVFAEMSGRIVVAKKSNFELVRERYSPRLSLATLVASPSTCASVARLSPSRSGARMPPPGVEG
ncbi:MAG TPA: hypothetical protein VGO48_13065 [Conexibacter sp.]|nr:hypothetical protein [Conexibacter sp.]